MNAGVSSGVTLSVVVATRGRSDGCRRMCVALESQLAEQPGLWAEIVMVFDGCIPYRWFQPSETRRSVHMDPRRGIAGARNAGVEAARGEVLAFLDDDAVPAPGWLASLLEALERYPHLDAFGGRVVGADQNNLYARLRDQVYYRETFGVWYVDPRSADGDLIGPPYVNGGNSAYRRRAMLDAGGFDTALPAYSDVELGRRLSLHKRAVLVAGMTVYHDHPSSFAQYMLRCYRSGRARGLMWTRHRYSKDSPRRVAVSILLNVLWNNAVRRSGRVQATRIRTTAVLSCQEVLHGVGYARSLVG